MGKKEKIIEMINLLSIGLRHKIGGIVNNNEIYSAKYARDGEILIKEAQKISLTLNFNIYEKSKIKVELTNKLRKELEKKDFLDDKKYNFVDSEIDKVLREFGIC